MAVWEEMEPFGIDNGELDGFSAQECFVLGYELCQFRVLADAGRAFTQLAHTSNRSRIEGILNRRGLEYDFLPVESYQWLMFDVKAMGW
jgi:hypothetical protein